MSNKVSVIIPCYNQAPFLEEAMDSVKKQSHTNWECIIVDDGSTDNSKEIALNCCALDSRFKYVYQNNKGLSGARNTGLKIASGDYIQFLDGDDVLHVNKFELQLIDLEDASIAVSNYFPFLDGDLQLAAPNRYLTPFASEIFFVKQIIVDWEYRLSIPCHAVLFSRKLQRDNSIFFNETLSNHEDWVFWVQLFYYAEKIKNNTNVLAYYRIRKTSMSTDYSAMRIGFLQGASVLSQFFKEKKEKDFIAALRLKRKEIKNKNKPSYLQKIKSRVKAKLILIYHYVKSN